MKLLTVKNTYLLLVAILLCAVSNAAISQQVYKVVDKDGNVTYTDTAPKDGTEPVKLPELSVIEAPDYQAAAKPANNAVEKGKSLRVMRSQYKDFAITSPQQDESLFEQDQEINIQWATENALVDGMQVKVSIDGASLPATQSSSITVPPMDRGEHTIDASLIDENGKVIAHATPVTFFVKQPTLNSNPQHVRPTPHN